jgi:hypothetical protein
MSTKDFECDFINDLESFVRNPIQIEPLDKWDPREIAAPERHFMLGKTAHKSLDSQVYMLRDNCAFQDVESILHMSFNSVEYSEYTEVHPIKEQAWLFGYRWLENYLKFIAMPGSMRKEFYRRHNDRFLEIIGCFLAYNPDERIHFYEALRMWNPQHELLSGPGKIKNVTAAAAAASVSAVSSASAVRPSAATVATSDIACASDHSIPTQPLESMASSATDGGVHHPAVSVPSGRRRLNLIRSYDSAGRTKTRKVGSSTRSPASDNRDSINQD